MQAAYNTYGGKWVEIAKLLPGRTDKAVRNRFLRNMSREEIYKLRQHEKAGMYRSFNFNSCHRFIEFIVLYTSLLLGIIEAAARRGEHVSVDAEGKVESEQYADTSALPPNPGL